MDWSKSQQIGITICGSVAFINPKTGNIRTLNNTPNEAMSLKFNYDGTILAIGCDDGKLVLYSPLTQSINQSFSISSSTVLVSDWKDNVIASGTRDGLFSLVDTRENTSVISSNVHHQEICGVRWSPHNHYTLATSSNDCTVKIWDIRYFNASSSSATNSSNINTNPNSNSTAYLARRASAMSNSNLTRRMASLSRMSSDDSLGEVDDDDVNSDSSLAEAGEDNSDSSLAEAGEDNSDSSLAEAGDDDDDNNNNNNSDASILQDSSDDNSSLQEDFSEDELLAAKEHTETPQLYGSVSNVSPAFPTNIQNPPQNYRTSLSTTLSQPIVPLVNFQEHQAAIRALAFSPTSQNIIVTGGGTSDKTIKMWDINTGEIINSIDTGSQVCNLFWNEEYNEIFSTHGFSQNQLALWRGFDLSSIAQFYEHKQRVLYMTPSPDETKVATAAPNDGIQIWTMFPSRRLSLTNSMQLVR